MVRKRLCARRRACAWQPHLRDELRAQAVAAGPLGYRLLGMVVVIRIMVAPETHEKGKDKRVERLHR